jgi:CO/xanthine dehydrogenase FAD-binding subunit
MRSNVAAYCLMSLPTLEATLELMAREPGNWKPFAGGTDLMVLFEAGKLPHHKFINIRHLSEMKGIEATADSVRIGALTTYTQILSNVTLQHEFPLLCRAASETGGVATQNRGTLGGNIANASPAADSPPALLVYDADLELVSSAGARWMTYSEFHAGYKKMQLSAAELIRSIRLPRRMNHWRQHYRKVGTRRAQAISKVCLAASADVRNQHVRDIRIAFGSVAPTVIRCERTEQTLRDRALDAEAIRKARETLAQEIAPIDDVRSTARYRLRVAQNLLQEFLLALGNSK